ncbi:MAG: hypothetical protein GX088_00405 [Clostridia bacterium]|nr:hypothetical protein [Clostridia bacterium]
MVSVGDQFFYFFITIITGVLIGICFDIYREAGRIFKLKKRKIISDLLDLMFWLTAVGISFTILLFVCHGEVRAYAFLGMGLGIFLYMSHLTNYGRKTLGIILQILCKILMVLWIILRLPFMLIQKLLFFPASLLSLGLIKFFSFFSRVFGKNKGSPPKEG